MILINEYSSEKELKNFPNLEKQIKDYYDLIITDFNPKYHITPRAYEHYRVGRRDIFYYICWLYDNNPNSVVDIGCGDNIFKSWFPNIHGVDVHGGSLTFNKPDEIMSTPEIFYSKNKEKFDCGMALNSIHFGSFEKVKQNIESCMSLLKSKGRFLFTINYSIVHHSTVDEDQFYKIYDEKYYNFVANTNYKLILYDCISSRGYKRDHQWLNGDVRFILEKSV